MLEPIDFAAAPSEEDLRRLEQHRLARLKEIIEPVSRAITLLDINNVFHLHCTSPALVDELLEWNVAEAAQIILGCQAVNVWFADEIVWSSAETELSFISEHHDIDFVRDSDMSIVAPLERNSVESIVQEAITPVIDETIDRAIDDYLNGDEMKSLIRQRVAQKIQARLSTSNANSNGKAEAATPASAATVEAPVAKPAARKTTTRKPAAKKTTKRTSSRTKKTSAEAT